MDKLKRLKKDVINEVFSYLDHNLAKCMEYSEKLEELLEEEELNIKEIRNYSSLSSFYFHLLENNLDFNIAYTWLCFFGKEDQAYLERKLEEAYDTFYKLGEKINNISNKMIDCREKILRKFEEEGYEETISEEIILDGFITPVENLEIRDTVEEECFEKMEEGTKKTKQDKNDIMYV